MQFTANTIDAASQSSACLIVGVFRARQPQLTATGERLDRSSRGRISAMLEQGDLDGAVGASRILYNLPGIKADRVLLVGLGRKKNFNLSALRRAARAAANALEKSNVRSAHLFLLEADESAAIAQRARSIVEGMEEALYRYTETKSGRPRRPKLKSACLACARDDLGDVRQGIRQGSAIAAGVALAKELGNLPGNVCTPSYLADQAKAMQKQLPVKTTVLGEPEMKKLGMGSLLSVSRGSREPARLIIMEYRGGAETEQPVVLVGKGLTFDAGGISLKPAAAMDEMKYDMCGGASVFGAVHAVAEMALPINLVGIVPASENLPDGAANKPGDIVTSMSGTTIEILNTDAEGRLILCDALTYAERYEPAAVVDIATLTGACVIALGEHASGLFSDSEELAAALLAAGEATGDRAWRMPVWKDYDKQLKSNFADLANIGGRTAGAVTAACFLRHFTDKFDWAHLDIAGTAWKSGGNKGATGRPVPLLVEFLMQRGA